MVYDERTVKRNTDCFVLLLQYILKMSKFILASLTTYMLALHLAAAKVYDNVKTVHVINSCHLDIGFADSSAGIVERYFQSISQTLSRLEGSSEKEIFLTTRIISSTLCFKAGFFHFI